MTTDLQLRRCNACGHIFLPLQWVCPSCSAQDFRDHPLPERGTIKAMSAARDGTLVCIVGLETGATILATVMRDAAIGGRVSLSVADGLLKATPL